ncbi:MAG: hypothetical protein ACJ73E_00505 [Mycobacteriales bacterium]
MLQVTPQVLADAAGTLHAQQELVVGTAVAIGAATHDVVRALPGSGTAAGAESTGVELAAAVRMAAAELAVLAVALGAAASEYLAVEREAAAGLERAGRRPS